MYNTTDHISSLLLFKSGVINTLKPEHDRRKFASTGDLESLKKMEASASDSPVHINKHAKSSTSFAGSPGGSRRGTIIPSYKHDYSHVKSSVNSGK